MFQNYFLQIFSMKMPWICLNLEHFYRDNCLFWPYAARRPCYLIIYLVFDRKKKKEKGKAIIILVKSSDWQMFLGHPKYIFVTQLQLRLLVAVADLWIGNMKNKNQKIKKGTMRYIRLSIFCLKGKIMRRFIATKEMWGFKNDLFFLWRWWVQRITS